jgi:hypothetical protein
MTTDSSIYQLKISLNDIKPAIWRRVQVPADIFLDDLHLVIQVAMGWENYHVYDYSKSTPRTWYRLPMEGEKDFMKELFGDILEGFSDIMEQELEHERDVRKTKINEVLTKENTRFQYQYDMGDSWYHTILLEKILVPEAGVSYPICLKGKRACPPEDCGGVWGYEDLLEILKDKKHDSHKNVLEWLDIKSAKEFDVEAFDIDGVNLQLKKLKFKKVKKKKAA